jgi:hypothetical protein
VLSPEDLLLSVNTSELGVFDFVVALVPDVSSLLPELDVVLLPELESPSISVLPLLFLPDVFSAVPPEDPL